MIKANIDVSKIDKNRLLLGKAHADGTREKFLSVVLMDDQNGRDKYGNDGFVCEEVTAEELETGRPAAIIGNWRRLLARVKAIKEVDAIAPSKSGDDLLFQQ